jgi:hypothetical protein
MYSRLNNLFEQSGIGDYDRTGDWSWEYYPPPYDFLAPADSVSMPAPILTAPGVAWRPSSPQMPIGTTAAGCGCGGTCGGCGGGHSHGGLGDGGLFNTGLFANPTDLSTWGVGEWATIGIAGYVLISLLHDTKQVARRTRKAGKAFLS